VCLGLRWTAKKRVGSSFCVPRCTQCLKLPAKTIQTCILLTADQVARRGRPRALATCLTSNPPLPNSRNPDREATRPWPKNPNRGQSLFHFTSFHSKVKTNGQNLTPHFSKSSSQDAAQPQVLPTIQPLPRKSKNTCPSTNIIPSPPAPVISPCDVPPSVVAMIRGQGMAAALLWLIHTQDTRVCKLSKRAGAPGGVM
jgi:hypothetical protein